MPITEYPAARDAAVIGQSYGPGHNRSLVNESGRATQSSSITVDTAENSTAYSVVIDGITITVTSDASATVTEIATALAAAINAEPLINGRVLATSAVGVVTLTARVSGYAFTPSTTDSNLTVATATASATPDVVPFGVLCISDGNGKAQECAATAITAKSYTLTPTAANSSTYSVEVAIPSVLGGFAQRVTYTSDGSATEQEIVEGLKALLDAEDIATYVATTEDDSSLTLTAITPGMDFEVSVQGQLTPQNAGQTLEDVAVGVSLRDLSQSIETAGYSAGSAMAVRSQGDVAVEVAAAVTPTDPVYARVSGSGAPFRGSAASGYLMLPRRLASWREGLSSTLAILHCNF